MLPFRITIDLLASLTVRLAVSSSPPVRVIGTSVAFCVILERCLQSVLRQQCIASVSNHDLVGQLAISISQFDPI